MDSARCRVVRTASKASTTAVHCAPSRVCIAISVSMRSTILPGIGRDMIFTATLRPVAFSSCEPRRSSQGSPSFEKSC